MMLENFVLVDNLYVNMYAQLMHLRLLVFFTPCLNIGYMMIYKPDIDGHMDAICDYVFNETVLAYRYMQES